MLTEMIFYMHQPSLDMQTDVTSIWPSYFDFPAFIALFMPLHFCSRENELSNVEIIVADISKFEMERSFDRIISIEMFEV